MSSESTGINISFSAAKDFNVNLKHIRREFEPELKAAGEHMLAAPWADLECLSKDAQFALSEVMHLSHSTHVQQQVIPVFINESNSVVVEAKTGSGKTLAFIVPLTERLRQQNFLFSSKHNHPCLSRNICAFIVSPSRVLAQQTFIVGRNYSCRYPFAVKYLLVDRHVEPLATTASRLGKFARGGGFVAVGTVADVFALNEFLSSSSDGGQNENENENEGMEGEEIDDHDENSSTSSSSSSSDGDDDLDDDPELKALMLERKKTMKEKLKQQKTNRNGANKKNHVFSNKNNRNKDQPQQESDASTKPRFAPLPSHKFVVIVDEADVVLKDSSSYSKLFSLCASICTQQQQQRVQFDFGLFGATATSASEVNQFVGEFQSKFASTTTLQTFQLSSLENDAADLRNLYEMAEPQNILQSFIHILNMHHSKKHFVFFNNIAVLNFVHRLLVKLSRGARPVLRTSTIFALHEGMKDSVRFEQFGKFVRYSGLEQQQQQHESGNNNKKQAAGSKQGWSESAKEKEAAHALGKKSGGGSGQHTHNHYYQHASGSVASQLSTGAILLCTDEAAFGLDVRDVDYVIHFEPPTSLQSFIHRSGRVARMGMSGTSILLLPETAGAKEFLKQVSDKLFSSGGKVITRLHVSNGGSAPIASNIAAFVEEIATDAEELEKINIAVTTSAIHLPSRRSRLVHENMEQQAQKMALSHKPSMTSGGQSSTTTNSNNNNNDDNASHQQQFQHHQNVGGKLVAQAIFALANGSNVYSRDEATAAIFSRC